MVTMAARVGLVWLLDDPDPESRSYPPEIRVPPPSGGTTAEAGLDDEIAPMRSNPRLPRLGHRCRTGSTRKNDQSLAHGVGPLAANIAMVMRAAMVTIVPKNVESPYMY